MSMLEIFEEYIKLNPDWASKTRANHSACDAACKKAAESGDRNACLFMSDYFSDALKAECAKHPDIVEYEEMYENSPKNF